MAIVLDAFITTLVGSLVTLARDEIVFLLGVQGVIKRLGKTLERMLPVLADVDM